MPTGAELQEQGTKQYMQHDYEQAIETFRKAVSAYDEEGKADLAAEMKVNLGLTLHALGEYEEALDLMTQAQTVFTGMGDKSRTAQVLGNMARVYAKMGNTEQAITNYREASATFIELGDEENYGQTVLAIADLQLRGGHLMQAAATYEVGLDYVKHPNARQKIMKSLLGVRNKITGGGSGKPDGEEQKPDENA